MATADGIEGDKKMETEEIRQVVKTRYGLFAESGGKKDCG